MARQEEQPKTPRDLRRQAREVADSLAIAFILAMIIRHYVLEVFKIPTKSMEPTLLGDPWSGDKILVNKFAYDFRDPRRWEIAVFKYPQDTAKNYIKRVIGLPGETVLVRYGDVYINGAIARKPWRVQESLWRLTPHSRSPEADPKPWRVTFPDGSQQQSADAEFTLDCTGGAGAEAELRYMPRILAYEAPANRPPTRPLPTDVTDDIMVEFHLIPREQAGALSVEIPIVFPESQDESRASVLDFWEVKLPLDRPELAPEVWRDGTLLAAGTPCRLPKGKATLVQVCNVDLTFLVRVDGAEVVRKEYEPSDRMNQSASFANEAHVLLRLDQAHVTIRDPGVYVDVHYTDNPRAFAVRKPYQLGGDEFFVLGDNSANSNDSRAWEKVPRSYLVGEAFLILWPLGRMKLVR
ncbi:MAG TPA: signal peptidase I [Planctomycetota bacterium]|nr:signal peptidase I [Planctomycetota bacterium]